jgi:hypothetical protein
MLAANETRISGALSGGEGHIVQSAHPRDVGALALVVGLFLILFVVSLTVGTPTR